METTYSIRAHDGQTYGPYPLASIQSWIREGRIGVETPMTRSDLTEWFPAGSFSELSFGAATPAAIPAPAQVPPTVYGTPATGASTPGDAMPASVKSGASWFYWAAVLTAINAGTWLFGSGIGFTFGFQIADLAIRKAHGSKPAGIVIYLVAIGFFALCGWFASRGAIWAFVAGGLAILCNAVLLATMGSFLSVAIHGYALFTIFGAMTTAIAIKKSLRR